MKKSIQFFALLIALFATTAAFAQAGAGGGGAGKTSTHDISFNADDQSQWDVKQLPENAPDGRHVLATSKTGKGQFIVVLRGGLIAQVGIVPVGGKYKALSPSSAPCSPSGRCLSFQIKHCYQIPGGGCVCVCGAWIATYPGN